MDKTKELIDFMNSFIDTPDPIINEQYYEIEKQYETLFGHSVPREMLPSGLSEKQLMIALEECIESNSDSLFEILGIKINYDHLY